MQKYFLISFSVILACMDSFALSDVLICKIDKDVTPGDSGKPLKSFVLEDIKALDGTTKMEGTLSISGLNGARPLVKGDMVPFKSEYLSGEAFPMEVLRKDENTLWMRFSDLEGLTLVQLVLRKPNKDMKMATNRPIEIFLYRHFNHSNGLQLNSYTRYGTCK